MGGGGGLTELSQEKDSQALSVGGGEDMMDSFSNYSKDSEREYESQGWKSPKAKRSKKKNKKKIIVATRTSSRIVRDGVPVVVKVENRAKLKTSQVLSPRTRLLIHLLPLIMLLFPLCVM